MHHFRKYILEIERAGGAGIGLWYQSYTIH